jgi:hypothetical protein
VPRIAWVLGVVAFLAADVSAERPDRRPLQFKEAVGLRVATNDPKAVQIELKNASGEPIDSDVLMKVSLKRLDDKKGPEHAQVIYTWVDPSTGLYKLPVPGEAAARLVLAAGEARTIKMEFSKFRWSYPAIGNRTPEALRDLAESGDFDLDTNLSLYDARMRELGWLSAFSQAGPIRVRLIVR